MPIGGSMTCGGRDVEVGWGGSLIRNACANPFSDGFVALELSTSRTGSISHTFDILFVGEMVWWVVFYKSVEKIQAACDRNISVMSHGVFPTAPEPSAKPPNFRQSGFADDQTAVKIGISLYRRSRFIYRFLTIEKVSRLVEDFYSSYTKLNSLNKSLSLLALPHA